jgi:hypothetical protein
MDHKDNNFRFYESEEFKNCEESIKLQMLKSNFQYVMNLKEKSFDHKLDIPIHMGFLLPFFHLCPNNLLSDFNRYIFPFEDFIPAFTFNFFDKTISSLFKDIIENAKQRYFRQFPPAFIEQELKKKNDPIKYDIDAFKIYYRHIKILIFENDFNIKLTKEKCLEIMDKVERNYQKYMRERKNIENFVKEIVSEVDFFHFQKCKKCNDEIKKKLSVQDVKSENNVSTSDLYEIANTIINNLNTSKEDRLFC